MSWFLHKLVEKRQSEQQQKQARHSITMFYRMRYNPIAPSEASQPATSSGISVRYQFSPLTIASIGTAETGAKPLTRPIKATQQHWMKSIKLRMRVTQNESRLRLCHYDTMILHERHKIHFGSPNMAIIGSLVCDGHKIKHRELT